ncbi:hypothetical protein CUMW_280640 [Citrus unshiu]|uniref:RRM domain-containing protein n=1 Tax=Citrus unshiu TaxID=55188 RepID=A0A2H5MWR7_CITUN|nr:hypothetical protein CUMW_280640 [Citrus unshiu]
MVGLILVISSRPAFSRCGTASAGGKTNIVIRVGTGLLVSSPSESKNRRRDAAGLAKGQGHFSCNSFLVPISSFLLMASGDVEFRCFVGGLAWATTDSSLHEAFGAYGDILESKIINDRETGRSRGFGFVTFRDEKSMRDAIEGMNGQNLDGRNITVNEAQSRGSGGGGGGGYGSRGGGGYGGGGRRESVTAVTVDMAVMVVPDTQGAVLLMAAAGGTRVL